MNIIILFFISSVLIFGQSTDLIKLGSSYRIYPGTVHQTEPFIAKDPSDPLHFFASANTTQITPFFISEGVYSSTDRGVTWRGNDTCTGPNITFHGGDPGIAIDDSGRYVLVRIGRAPVYGLYSHTSNDRGLTWTVQKQISDHDLERATVLSDNNPSSPYYGRVYAAWVRFAPPFPVYISYTDDAGASWSAPLQVNNPPQRCAGPDLAIRNDGTVYLTWAGVTNTSPFQETRTGFAVSSNGGASWSVTENAFAVNGITGSLPQKQNIRVNGYPRIGVDNSGGPYDGRLYILTTQRGLAPAGSDADLILTRSTDGGLSWGSPVRVNADPLNNGKTQYFPAMDIDDNGGVNLLWYDDRETTNDSTDVYMARSLNGGENFNEVKISEKPFKPEPIGSLGQGYQGDNIALISSGNYLIPLWMENSSGKYQIRTAQIKIITSSAEEAAALPAVFELLQNYPNPFNPETILQFRIQSAGMVKMRVYTLNGELAAEPVSGYLAEGEYQVSFNPQEYGLGSGIYFYSLESGNQRVTRGMVYTK
ncbi:MAG: hypothetical protein FMNOHCHN_00429 [Ignavibacteriaceae bacterium]|nr:hypothetical protein [Ignavibacteriaceae bacterium]